MRFFLLLFIPILNYTQNSNLSLLDHWTTDTLPVCYDNQSIFNEVWGFTFNQHNYAVIGSTSGTHFFQIVENNLLPIDFVKGKHFGRDVVHRDYHDYNGYLYMVCDEGPSSLQIVDLKYLPDSISLVYDSDSLFVKSHNIFIDTLNKKLYACAVTTKSNFNAMSVYDVSNPINPSLIYNYNNVSHVHDAYVWNDTAYLNCGNDGLKIIKSSSNFPIQIGQLNNYIQKGYNHSGWLNKEKTSYVMCDENYGLDVKIVDVSSIDEPEIASFLNSSMGNDENSVAHNVIVRNNIAFISYYHDGLQIFDISNPSSPKKIAYYDTYLQEQTTPWAGAWGVYPFTVSNLVLVSDRANGLFLFNFIPPPLVTNLSVNVLPNPVNDFFYFHRNHYGISNYYLKLYDISGKLVRSYQGENDYLRIENIKDLKSGIYILKYISNLESVNLQFKIFKN